MTTAMHLGICLDSGFWILCSVFYSLSAQARARGYR